MRSVNPNFFFAKVLPDSNNYEYTYTLHASQRRLQAANEKRAAGQKQMRFVKGKVSSPQTPNEAEWDRKYILSHGSDLGQNLSDNC